MRILLIILSYLVITTTETKGQTQSEPTPQLIVNQLATVNPTDDNPLDYQDKIENTVYQSGDRLIVIQSIPLKYIKEATAPNTQPTINDFPQL